MLCQLFLAQNHFSNVLLQVFINLCHPWMETQTALMCFLEDHFLQIVLTWGTRLSFKPYQSIASFSNSSSFHDSLNLILSWRNTSPMCSSWIRIKNALVFLKVPKYKLVGLTSTTRFRSLNSYINFNSFIVIADMCNNFRVNTSTTTLAFTGL